jgi:hypothetical protein
MLLVVMSLVACTEGTGQQDSGTSTVPPDGGITQAPEAGLDDPC